MIPTTAAFAAAAAQKGLQPVCVLDLPTLGLRWATAAGQPGLALTGAYMQMPDGMSQAIDDLKGTSTLGTLAITISDVGQTLLPLFATKVWYGARANLLVGFRGLAFPTDYIQPFSGIISTVVPTPDRGGWIFTIVDRKRTLRTQAYGTGGNGLTPTSSTNPRTLDGNPMDLVTQLLEGELGISPSDIDTGSIAALRNGRLASARMLFSLTKVVDALSFMETELLLPLGLFHFVRYDGRLAIGDVLDAPSPVTSAFAFTDSNTQQTPTIQQRTIYNSVLANLDYDGAKYLYSDLFEDVDSLTKYGLQQQLTISSQGLRTNLQGASRAGITARRIFLRYANGPARLIALTCSTLAACTVEVGDYTGVTSAKLEDLDAGTRGWANKPCLAVSVQPHWAQGTVDLTLLDVSSTIRQAYQFAPNTQPSWPTATLGERQQYLFMANNASQQSDGTPAAGVF